MKSWLRYDILIFSDSLPSNGVSGGSDGFYSLKVHEYQRCFLELIIDEFSLLLVYYRQ